MREKRILHLITGLDIGGAEMMLLKTIPSLRMTADHRVCSILGHGPIGEQLEQSGVPVYYLELKNIFDFGVVLRFKKIITDFQPDILVTHLIHADLFGRIFGRLFGVKIVICNQRGKLLQWEFLRIIDRMTKFLVTKYIVQTETAKQELMTKLNLPPEKFEIIPNTIDVKEFDFELDKEAKRKSLDLETSDFVITCVSNLRRGKGHEYLLEAFENLYQQNTTQKHHALLIVGDGEQKNKLLRQVSEYQSKHDIRFLGNRKDVKEILRISDTFILPTLGEGMSNAIMEAMASGLPIITTDLPENRELIINQRTGILVPSNSATAITRAIRALLDDESRRKTLGKNTNEKIRETFNNDIVILRIVKFFHEL